MENFIKKIKMHKKSIFLPIIFSFVILVVFFYSLPRISNENDFSDYGIRKIEKNLYEVDFSAGDQNIVKVGLDQEKGVYATLSRFNKSSSLTISYLNPDVSMNDNLKVDKDVIKWVGENEEVHFYKINDDKVEAGKGANTPLNSLRGSITDKIGLNAEASASDQETISYFNLGNISLLDMAVAYESLQLDENQPSITLNSSNEDGFMFYGDREASRDLRLNQVSLPMARVKTIDKGDGCPVVYINKEGMLTITVYDPKMANNHEEFMSLVTDAYNEILREYGIEIRSDDSWIYYMDGLKMKILGRKAIHDNYLILFFYLDSPLSRPEYLEPTRNYLKLANYIVDLVGLRDLSSEIDYSFGEKVVEKIASKLNAQLDNKQIDLNNSDIQQIIAERSSDDWIKDAKSNVAKTNISDVEKFEVELVLNSRPNTNVFSYQLEFDNLEFHYQSALSDEEVENGSYRPENIVGSYAVYTTESISKENKTGKVFHIYRPKIVDASGEEIWGELNIDTNTNILSITVPEDFLNEAEYPVKVDPTFGFDGVGASSVGSGVNQITGSIFHFNSDSNGIANSINSYTFVNGGKISAFDYSMAIYNSDFQYMTETNILQATQESQWHSFNFIDPVFLEKNKSYILVVKITTNGAIDVWYDDIPGSSMGIQSNNSHTEYPSVLSDFTISDNKYSIYIDYDEVAPRQKISYPSAQSNLVGHWTMDATDYNGTINRMTDRTPYNKNKINYGATFTTDRFGKEGGAMNFNGASTYMVIENSNSDYNFTAGQPFSYGAWFNASSFPASWHGIISKMPTWGNGYNLQVGPTQNIACGIGVYVKTTWAPQTNTWYHAMCVYDGSVMRLYVNGLEEASATHNVNTGNTDLKIGMFYTSGSLPFFGKIDDVRIYKRALSASEVKSLVDSYNLKTAVGSLKKDLVLDMPLKTNYTKSEAPGSEIMTDRTPYSNDGQNYGATINQSGATFDGVNDYVQVLSDESLNITKSITISFWYKVPELNRTERLITKRALGGSYGLGYETSFYSTNRFLTVYNNGNNRIYQYSNYINSPEDVGKYFHYTYVYNYEEGYQKSFVNGEDFSGTSSFTVGHEAGSTSGAALDIGRRDSDMAKGELSNLKIYSRALSDDEIKSLYERERAGGVMQAGF